MANPLFYPSSGVETPKLLTEAEVAAMRPTMAPSVAPSAGGQSRGGLEILSFEPTKEQTVEPDKQHKPRSLSKVIGDTAGDIGTSVLGGFAGLAEMAGSFYGLLSGDMDNGVRNEGRGAREFWNSLKSDYLKGEEKQRAEAIEKQDGELAKLWTAVKLTAKNPALITSFIGEQAPQLLPVLKAGALANSAGQVVNLSATNAARLAVGAGVGAGAVMQGSDVGSDAFDDLMKAPQEQWLDNPDYRKLIDAGASDNEARTAVAIKEARIAGLKGGAATVVTSMLPGARTVEKVMARVPGGGSRLASAAKGFAGEGISEGAEEAYGRVAVNQGVQEVDPSRDTFSGVGEAAGMGALMGGVFGGAAGASIKPKGLLQSASEAAFVDEARKAAQGDAAWLAQSGVPALPAPMQRQALPYEQVAEPIGSPTPWPPQDMLSGPGMAQALPPPEARAALPRPVQTGEIVVDAMGNARPGTTTDTVGRQQFPNVTTPEELAVDQATNDFEVMGFAPLKVDADRVAPKTEATERAPSDGVKTPWDDLPKTGKSDRKALGYNGVQDLMDAGGINIEAAGDIFGEGGARAARIRPGLFRKRGGSGKPPMGLDEVVQWMSSNGYLDSQVESGNELSAEETALDLIRDAVLNKSRLLKAADRVELGHGEATRMHMEDTLREAERRGIPMRGRGYADVARDLGRLVAADEAAYQRKEQAGRAQEAQQDGRNERQAIQSEAEAVAVDLADAPFTDAELDRLSPRRSVAEELRAFGFTEDEINEFTNAGTEATDSRGDQAPESLAQEGAGEGNRAGEANTPAEEGEGFSLSAETPDEVRARSEEGERVRQEQARRDGAPPAEDFVLTGSDRNVDQAEARGQTGMFDGSAGPAITADGQSINSSLPEQDAGAPRSVEPERRANDEARAKADALPADERDAEIQRLREQNAELKRQLDTDSLTTTKSREAYQRDKASAKGVAFIDLIAFKGYNTKFTETGGDAILREFGRVMTEVGGDAAYRRGGDEFAFLSDRSSEHAAELAARMQNAMEAVTIELADKDGNAYIVQGIPFRFGIGATDAEAVADNARRKKSGDREQNPNVSRKQADQGDVGEPAARADERNQDQPQEEVRAPETGSAAAGQPGKFSLKSFGEFMQRLRDGEVDIEEFSAEWERLTDSRATMVDEFDRMRKSDILNRFPWLSVRYGREKKDALVSAAVDSIYDHFNIRGEGISIGFSQLQNYEKAKKDALSKIVNRTTPKDLQDYADSVANRKKSQELRQAALKAAIENPQSLDDYKMIRESGNLDQITPEQRRRFEDMTAEAEREAKKIEAEKRAKVDGVKSSAKARDIIETKHTRDGYALFVVQLSDRVGRDEYSELNGAAKKLGGWYSSFRGAGAAPGFQFKTKQQAEQFRQVVDGQSVSGEDRIAEKVEAKQSSAVQKLLDMADRLEEKANKVLNADRNTNTARRARIADSVEKDARSEIALAKTMRSLAQAVADGKAKHLDRISQKTQVQLLSRMAAQARDESIRKNGDHNKEAGRPVRMEDIDSVSYPKYDIYADDVIDLANGLKGKRGAKTISERLLTAIAGVKDNERTKVVINSELAESAIEKAQEYNSKHPDKEIRLPWYFEYVQQDRKRLLAMGLTTESQLRAALREFIQFKSDAPKVDKVTQLERDLVGRKDVGFDFFPTPKNVSQQMVDMADIRPGMRVLEPSAGNGNIAEEIKAAGVPPDVVEISGALRDILEARGFNLVGRDFMDLEADTPYDRIVMNPPFSNGADIDHVRHAYSLLSVGGRLVSIVGEGAFIRSDKKATEFREWLEAVGATEEKLPSGTFTDKKLLSTTGANARLVTIEKLKSSASNNAMFSRGSGKAATADELTNALRSAFGKDADKLLEAGRVRIVQSVSDLPGNGHPNDVGGMFWRGDSWIVADNTSADQIRGRVLHEVGVHAGMRKMLGDELYKETLRIIDKKAETDPAFKKARAKAERSANDPSHVQEETLAYLIEDAPESSAVRRVLSAIRQWVYRITGGRLVKLTKADLQEMAVAALRRHAREAEIARNGESKPWYMTVFHGSPFRFSKFTLDHIGKGEGAQAYGWGLYFASKKEVANWYTGNVSGGAFVPTFYTIKGERTRSGTPEQKAADLIYSAGLKDAQRLAKSMLADAKAGEEWTQAKGAEYYQRVHDLVFTLKNSDVNKADGQLYEVKIPEDGEYLLWDKPLSEQPEKVRKALLGGDEIPNLSGQNILEMNAAGEEIYRALGRRKGTDEDASKYLHSLGIAGIKYLDGSSRGAGDGSYNYVVFDENAIEILNTYYSRNDAKEESKAESKPSRFKKSRTEIPEFAKGMTDAQKETLRKAGMIHEEPTLVGRASELLNSFKKEFVQGVADQFRPMKDIDLGAYKKMRMAAASDGGVEVMFLYGKPFLDADGAIDVKVSKDGSGGFLHVLQGLNGEHDRFMSWMAGKRATQLKNEGRENLFTDEDITFLRTLTNGKMRDGRDRSTVYMDAAGKLRAFNESVLDIAEKSGLIDPESRALWANDFYVPFFRVMEEGVAGPTIKSGLVNQYGVKKLKGGTKELNDLLKNTMMNWAHLMSASAKNRAASAALGAIERIGGAIEADESTIRALGKDVGKKAVSFMDAGRRRWFLVEDKAMLDAMTAIEWAGFGPIMKPFQAAKHWLTFGVTISPTFKVTNLMRDTISAIGTGPVSYNPAKNLADGWAATKKGSQAYASMLAGGGMMRFGSLIEGKRADHVRRLVERGIKDQDILDSKSKVAALSQKIWDAYQDIGDRSENVNRAAIYQQLRAKGASHFEASYQARDLMDFSLQGKWAIVRFLVQVVPFMNARLQGLYKLGRASQEDKKRFGIVVGAVALASIALMLMGEDDKEWKRREDWDRDAYWWVRIGGYAVRIPKPFEIGALGTLAERTWEFTFNEEMTGRRYRQRLADMFANTFAMSPIPQAAKPILDVYSNKDSFTGRDIESPGMERLRPEDRQRAGTSELAKLFGQLGIPQPAQLAQGRYEELSPVQIDHLMRGYFGSISVGANMLIDSIFRPIMDRPERPERGIEATPLIGRFVEELPSTRSRYISEFYEQAKEVEQNYASWRDALKAGNKDNAAEIEDEVGKKNLNLGASSARYRDAMGKYNLMIRQLESDKVMTSEAKREKLRGIRDKQEALARQFIEASRQTP